MNINAAKRETAELVDLWLSARQHPDSPPFSGGVLDSWPDRLAQAIAVMNIEDDAVRALLQYEEREALSHG